MKECGRKQRDNSTCSGRCGRGQSLRLLTLVTGLVGRFEDGRVVSPQELTWQALSVQWISPGEAGGGRPVRSGPVPITPGCSGSTGRGLESVASRWWTIGMTCRAAW